MNKAGLRGLRFAGLASLVCSSFSSAPKRIADREAVLGYPVAAKLKKVGYIMQVGLRTDKSVLRDINAQPSGRVQLEVVGA